MHPPLILQQNTIVEHCNVSDLFATNVCVSLVLFTKFLHQGQPTSSDTKNSCFLTFFARIRPKGIELGRGRIIGSLAKEALRIAFVGLSSPNYHIGIILCTSIQMV